MFADSGDGDVESLIDLLLPCLFYRLQVAEFFCINVAKQRESGQKQRFEKVPESWQLNPMNQILFYCRGRQFFVVL